MQAVVMDEMRGGVQKPYTGEAGVGACAETRLGWVCSVACSRLLDSHALHG